MLRRLFSSNLLLPDGFCSKNFVRRLCIASTSQNTEITDFDIIDDAVIRDPHRDAAIRIKNLRLLQKKFVHCFGVNEKEAKKLIDMNKALEKVPLDNISRNIELLYEKKITCKNIMDNPWLLGVPPKYLAQKIACVERLKPRNLNDFIPLVRVSQLVLLRTQKKIEREAKYIPEGNRIYFFSERLNLEPIIISKYFSTHMFMFEVTQEMLFENLDIMLEYKIAPMSIIRDLWAFKYLGKSIRARFDRCKKGSKDILKPWMVRCTEDVLQRTLFLSQESKNLLGESTEVDYLSERLGYDKTTIENLLKKHKGVLQVRIVKMKEILDYMLDVEKFATHEIVSNLRILCHSLETTKARMEELNELGCRPSSIVILMKSQTEYKKFLNSWIARREKMHKDTKSNQL